MIALDTENIAFSKRDREKGLKLPDHLNEDLAEFIGIHLGFVK